jgi:predicted anti-sigma-YlaC factor YlaD
MTPCERLSDRLPEVARGSARWTPEEAAHLAACAECRAEWELVAATIRLGGRAPQGEHPDAIATAVLRRVAEDRRSRARRRFWGLGLAAAAALAGVIWAGDRPEPGVPPVATIENTMPDSEPLGTAELDSMLEALDASQLGASALDEPSLNDLDTNELEQVLSTLEG